MKKHITWSLMLVMVLMFGVQGFPGQNKRNQKKYEYFSKNSFFVYGAASTNNLRYYELGYSPEDAIAPVLGVGFRAINFGNKYFLNLSFDFTPAKFDFYDYPDQKVNFYNLMVDFEGRFFRRSFVSLYLGIGVGFLSIPDRVIWDYWYEEWLDQGSTNITTMTIEVGFKVPLTRSNKLLARGGVRFYGEISPDYDDWYWDDLIGDWEHGSDFERVNTQLLLGLEFHF